MMTDIIKKNIEEHLEVINSSISWADTYGKESFPKSDYKEYRRQVKKIRDSLSMRRIHLFSLSFASLTRGTVLAHPAMGTVPAAGGYPFFPVFHQLYDDPCHDQNKYERDHDRSEVFRDPCNHIVFSKTAVHGLFRP